MYYLYFLYYKFLLYSLLYLKILYVKIGRGGDLASIKNCVIENKVPKTHLKTNFKDSTNINAFSNCKEFIVGRDMMRVNCPVGKENSYKNQDGYGLYEGKFVGLDKVIINNNMEEDLFSNQCIFKGKNYSHLEESTSQLHQLLPVQDKDITYYHCYAPCPRANDLKNLRDGEDVVNCELPLIGKYRKKYHWELSGFENIEPNVDGKYYISAEHCNNLKAEKIYVSDDSKTACKAPSGIIGGDIEYNIRINNNNMTISIGTIGNNYWSGEKEYVRAVNIGKIFPNLDMAKSIYINHIEEDDWLEIKLNENWVMTVPYNFKNIRWDCPPKPYYRFADMHYDNDCTKSTGIQAELSSHWIFSLNRNINTVNILKMRTSGNENAYGEMPFINMKNFLINNGNGDQWLVFKTMVSGAGEFYAEITVEY